mmetsp:Transcript_20452/g.41670  ORF Transcript_20452/g.41670 Transcript_20452/m.41670 type:complete len:105 (+) Transcript_20452:303-617(+)
MISTVSEQQSSSTTMATTIHRLKDRASMMREREERNRDGPFSMLSPSNRQLSSSLFGENKSNSTVDCDDISRAIEECMVSPSNDSRLMHCDATIKYFCATCMRS